MRENRKNYFFWNAREFEDAIREYVCSKCVDYGEDGVCHTHDPRGCALLRYLPQLVMIAQHLKEESFDEYLREVREKICMKCANQDPHEKCHFRDTVECGLDAYLPLVLEAIEKEDAVLQEKRDFGNGFEGAGSS